MIIKDRTYIIGVLKKVETNLRYYADSVARTTASFEKNGGSEDMHYMLNEILWALPNLGVQTVISSVMREMELQALRQIEEQATQSRSDDETAQTSEPA